MIRNEHLDLAVAQGILTAEQAGRLRTLAEGGAPADADRAADPVTVNPDDERFRLIGGFNDIFVTIGVGLLVAALFGLSGAFGLPFGFSVFAVIAAWGLSEVFSRRMRLALPSIALAIMFAGSAASVFLTLGVLILSLESDPPLGLVSLLMGLGATVAAIAHERRFHVPINAAIASVGLFCIVNGGIGLATPDADGGLRWFGTIVLFGLGIFAVALRIDASDPMRQTRRADIAFWLHLVAAPMIVHGTIPLLVGAPEGMNVAQAFAVLGIYAVLGLIAIVIDRRALLVSGLLYAGVALGYLVNENVETSFGSSLTLLVLAVIVLGISAGWRTIRRTLIPLLPLGALKHSIPPAR